MNLSYSSLTAIISWAIHLRLDRNALEMLSSTLRRASLNTHSFCTDKRTTFVRLSFISNRWYFGVLTGFTSNRQFPYSFTYFVPRLWKYSASHLSSSSGYFLYFLSFHSNLFYNIRFQPADCQPVCFFGLRDSNRAPRFAPINANHLDLEKSIRDKSCGNGPLRRVVLSFERQSIGRIYNSIQ